MKKFSVGEKIHVYDMHGKYVGIVEYVEGDKVYYAVAAHKHQCCAHIKQCRRLIKKKGVRVTREMLAKAWDNVEITRPIAQDSMLFGRLCKELGLG